MAEPLEHFPLLLALAGLASVFFLNAYPVEKAMEATTIPP